MGSTVGFHTLFLETMREGSRALTHGSVVRKGRTLRSLAALIYRDSPHIAQQVGTAQSLGFLAARWGGAEIHSLELRTK